MLPFSKWKCSAVWKLFSFIKNSRCLKQPQYCQSPLSHRLINYADLRLTWNVKSGDEVISVAVVNDTRVKSSITETNVLNDQTVIFRKVFFQWKSAWKFISVHHFPSNVKDLLDWHSQSTLVPPDAWLALRWTAWQSEVLSDWRRDVLPSINFSYISYKNLSYRRWTARHAIWYTSVKILSTAAQ